MKKLFNLALAVVLIAMIAGDVLAQSTYQDSSAWTKKYQKESVGLPEKLEEPLVGWYIYTWSITRDGGALGNRDTGINIPDNAIIFDGFVDVITACLPATNSFSLTMNSTNDLMTATDNNVDSTGLKATVPVGTVATGIKATADRDLYIVIGGDTAMTTGVAKVFLKYYQSQ